MIRAAIWFAVALALPTVTAAKADQSPTTAEQRTRDLIAASTTAGLMSSPSSRFVVSPKGEPMHEQSGLVCPLEVAGLALQVIGAFPPSATGHPFSICWYYNKPDPASGLTQLVLHISLEDEPFDPNSKRGLVAVAKAYSEFMWGSLIELGLPATSPSDLLSPQFARTYRMRSAAELSGIWIGTVGGWHLQARSKFHPTDRGKSELACESTWRAAAQTISRKPVAN